MAAALEIHVFGHGFGESIVVKLPQGSVVVIDSLCTDLEASSREERLRSNPVLHFLVEEIEAERIALLVFTHPHDDHGRGLSHILEEYTERIDQICTFPGFDSIELIDHFSALRESVCRLPVERILGEEPGSFSEELYRITELVSREADHGPLHHGLPSELADYHVFSIPGEPDVRFHFLGPNEQSRLQYTRQLRENLEGFVSAEGEFIKEGWDPAHVDHDDICGAILIEYGNTRVLLGADVQGRAWEQIVSEQDREDLVRPLLDCDFVKVSHHGSCTGYSDDLFERLWGEKNQLIAALTPFNRSSDPLPDATGIAFLTGWVSALFTTENQETTGDAETKPLGPVPVELWNMIPGRPELASALNPELSHAARGFPVAPKAIPIEWYKEILEDPSLVRSLHPQLRRGVRRNLRSENGEYSRECRLSFHFNDRGEELKDRRYMGRFAAQLH